MKSKYKIIGVLAVVLAMFGTASAVNYDYVQNDAIDHVSPENESIIALEDSTSNLTVEVAVDYSDSDLDSATDTTVYLEDEDGNSYEVTSESYTAGDYTSEETYTTDVDRETLEDNNLDADEELSVYTNVTDGSSTVAEQETTFEYTTSQASAVMQIVMPLIFFLVIIQVASRKF